MLGAGHWSTLPLVPRTGASLLWTGRVLLVWGGASGSNGDMLHADGASYDPQTSRWRALPTGPLSPRDGQGAVWTGTEMVVWGGYDHVTATAFRVSSDGAAYNPVSNRWRRLPTAPLSARAYPSAVWTGSRVIVLGGQPAVLTDKVRGYQDGASYNPATNRWQHLDPPTSPDGHPLTWRTMVQAGSQLLAWSEWATSRVTGPGSSTSAGGVDLFGYDELTGRWRSIRAAPNALPDAQEVL
jgi:N-acetylneuraminic acid mutarotase